MAKASQFSDKNSKKEPQDGLLTQTLSRNLSLFQRRLYRVVFVAMRDPVMFPPKLTISQAQCDVIAHNAALVAAWSAPGVVADSIDDLFSKASRPARPAVPRSRRPAGRKGR